MTVATTLFLNALASTARIPCWSCAVPGRYNRLLWSKNQRKNSVIGTIFIALVLIGVIAYGVQKLRPVIEDARQINAAQKRADKDSAAATAPTDAVGKHHSGDSR